ncbi:DUF5977 domain-containing protein [Pedobacter cryoconitis]|uniref:DUF5977 domain-containing protein n=1 Tax=Pedobacter cryoconitis TaxID=188932 RepID=UPI0016198567|nr:DUF5977 domain-containing protein [Pedobacter cryoconitis]MBB5648888.1 YD repeat-containing protein [Pedobacter cryoconitis]
MRKYLCLLLIGLFFVGQAIAQTSGAIKYNSPIGPSPNAASLGKYGDISVSTYTGVPDIKIPFYEIKVGTNTLPIGLSYHAGGFKVSDESSWVGLGWSLNAGGVITRSKTAYDDLSGKGYFRRDISTDLDGNDKQPDMFYFNFGGFTGKFIIDHSSDPGKSYVIRVLSTYDDSNLKIELVNEKSWLITDKFGNKYEFNTTEMQTDGAVGAGVSIDPVSNNLYASSWFLDKITYTNGEEITFNYTQGLSITQIPLISDGYLQGHGGVVPGCYQLPPSVTMSRITYKAVVKTQILTGISFPGGKVDIGTISDRVDLLADGGKAPRISSLKVYSKNQTGFELIKEFNFSQSYFSSSSAENYLSKRLRLDKVSESGVSSNVSQDYTFNYNSITLPNKNSFDMDHWGYYNGPKNNETLYQFRSPNATYVQAGLLESIIFPTQVKTSFTYEINDFSNLGTSLDWTTPNNKGMLGSGVRISRITNGNTYIPGLIYNDKSFEYSLDNGRSSGKIMSNILYIRGYTTIINGPIFPPGPCQNSSSYGMRVQMTVAYSNSAIPISGDAQGNIIGYDRVSITNLGGTHKNRTTLEYHNYSTATTDYFPLVPATNNGLNGLLKKQTDYLTKTSGESVIKEVTNEYTIQRSGYTKGFVFAAGFFKNTVSTYDYYIASQWITKDKTTEKIFDVNNNSAFITKVTNYSFDQVNNQKIEEKLTDSKGEIFSTKFSYPKDMVLSGNSIPYAEMQRRNMIGYIIGVEKYKNSLLLDKIYNDYTDNLSGNTNLILPQGIRSQRLSGAPEQRLTYSSYDKKGNILTVSYESGIKTAYLWSYDSQYPVAEIKNATYSQVQSVLGAASIETFSNLFNPDKSTIDTFLAGLKSGLPEAELTTYSYKPLVGLTSQTDVKGQTTYYEYDSFQRLKNIKDQNQNLVKNIQYNYVSNDNPIFSNGTRSVTFRRNNCEAGSTGSEEIYVVPAGKFSASTKEAMEALVQADIDANGQNEANRVGRCIVPPLCEGEDKKIINGVCESGNRVYTSSIPKNNNTYVCYYHYVFSDGSTTATQMESGHTQACIIE